MLRRCLDEAGIPLDDVYWTNAVKPVKHEQRGKRRIHQKPTTAEIDACHPWLAAELGVLRADDRAAEVKAALVEDLRRAHSVVHQNFS